MTVKTYFHRKDFALGETQTAFPDDMTTISRDAGTICYAGTTFGIRHADLTNTIIGTRIGQINRGIDGGGIQNNSYALLADEPLALTDKIFCQIYRRIHPTLSWTFSGEWLSAELGALHIHAGNILFYYHTVRETIDTTVFWDLYYGGEDCTKIVLDLHFPAPAAGGTAQRGGIPMFFKAVGDEVRKRHIRRAYIATSRKV